VGKEVKVEETKYLKDNIQNIQQLFAIHALKDFEIKTLGQMIRLSKMRRYEDGEQIIKEGDMDPWFYFLLSGKVRVEKEGIIITTLSKMGEIFGEMRLVDNLSRSASVYSVGKTVCLAVNPFATERLSSASEAANLLLLLYRVFVEFLSIRLRLANEELIKTKKQLKKITDKQ
jgi:CRP-like cAMP-binding protein